MGLKIAMIGQKGLPASWGGVERHVEELAAALCELGHEVTVYSRPHYAAPIEQHRGARVISLPSIATRHLDAISHSLLATLHALGEGYDVVHYHGIGPALACPPARAAARVVVTVHALDWRRAKWGPVARWALRAGEALAARAAHRLIAVTPAIAAHLRRAHGVESIIIPNGVAPPVVRPLEALRRRLELEEDAFVLYLGRFVPEKGCHLLVSAFRRLRTDRKLLLAGELEAGDRYLARLRRLAAGDKRIEFTGGLYGAEKEEALSHAALFCLPSELEGMSISLLEAMNYGRCVVASDIAENRALLETESGPLGLLFRAGDADDLRAKLEQALAQREEGAAIGRRAAEAVRRRCDWREVARRTAEVYSS